MKEIWDKVVAFCKVAYQKTADFLKMCYEKTADFVTTYYDKAVTYCTENTQQAMIIGVGAAVVLVLLLVLIISAAKRKKKKKAAKMQAQVETIAESQTVAPASVEVTPATLPSVAAKAEETPAKEVETVEVAKTEPVQAQNFTVEKVVEDEPTVEPIIETPIAEELALSEAEAAPSVEAIEEPTTVAVKEPSTAATLHDELKDVNTDMNFYEEDTVDQEARYRGKWVICRLVTDDKESEEMYFFELHASNGEKLLTSEEYTSYNGAIRGIQTHKTNIAKGNFRITISKRGEYIFKLLSGKNMLLCMGESYTTKARCEAAIASTKRFAETAVVDENVQYEVVKVPVEDDTPIEPLKAGYQGKWIIDCTEMPDGEKTYTFELFANNGERLLSSEEYTTYIGAVNGIHTHKQNIEKGNFRIVLTKRGDYIYKLLNSNGQLLCLGEHYKTKRLCQNAVESVKRFALSSPILTDSKIKK